MEQGKSVARWNGDGTANGGILSSQLYRGVSQMGHELGSSSMEKIRLSQCSMHSTDRLDLVASRLLLLLLLLLLLSPKLEMKTVAFIYRAFLQFFSEKINSRK